MFRVLLPDGELTLFTRIEFLKETVNCEKTGTTDLVVTLDGANAVFVHLKEPYTSSKGVLFSNLILGIRQKVRHRTLIPVFTGSSPVCPVQRCITSEVLYAISYNRLNALSSFRTYIYLMKFREYKVFHFILFLCDINLTILRRWFCGFKYCNSML